MRETRKIETGKKYETLEIGHALFREDVPQLITTKDKISKIETTTLDVGSYKGSECLNFGVKVETYFCKSDRAIAKYGHVSIPYSEVEVMETLRDTIDQAITDAKEWQTDQAIAEAEEFLSKQEVD